MKQARVLVSGYYGFDNLGDELILRVLIQILKKSHAHIIVLSNNPEKTSRDYGVEAIGRTRILTIMTKMLRCNLLISGGGGLFQDVTGPMSVLYYGGLIHLARFFRVPVCFWGQGVGPLERPILRKLTGMAIKKCQAVIVRDEKSAQLVAGLTGTTPQVSSDPVWLMNPSTNKNGSAHLKKIPLKANSWRMGLSLRPWPSLTPERIQALADCLSDWAKTFIWPVEILLLPFQPQDDEPLLNQFAQSFKATSPARTVMIQPDSVLEAVSSCNVLIGMRFHSLILGILNEVPIYGLVYDPKVSALLSHCQLHGTPIESLEGLNAKTLQLCLDHYPRIDIESLKQQAYANVQVIHRLLELNSKWNNPHPNPPPQRGEGSSVS